MAAQPTVPPPKPPSPVGPPEDQGQPGTRQCSLPPRRVTHAAHLQRIRQSLRGRCRSAATPRPRPQGGLPRTPCRRSLSRVPWDYTAARHRFRYRPRTFRCRHDSPAADSLTRRAPGDERGTPLRTREPPSRELEHTTSESPGPASNRKRSSPAATPRPPRSARSQRMLDQDHRERGRGNDDQQVLQDQLSQQASSLRVAPGAPTSRFQPYSVVPWISPSVRPAAPKQSSWCGLLSNATSAWWRPPSWTTPDSLA